MDSAHNLFIDPKTGTPLRWLLQVEVKSPVAHPGIFLWQSDTPRIIFAYPKGQDISSHDAMAWHFLDEVTGFPMLRDLRDFAARIAFK